MSAPAQILELSPLLQPEWDNTFGDPRLVIHKGRVFGQGTIATIFSAGPKADVVVGAGRLPEVFRPSSSLTFDVWSDDVNADECDLARSWPMTIHSDGSITMGEGGGFGNAPRTDPGCYVHLNTVVYDLAPIADAPTYEALDQYMTGSVQYAGDDAMVAADGRVHFQGHVIATDSVGSVTIVAYPHLPTKYRPDVFVAGKVFGDDGHAWTVQAGSTGYLQVAHSRKGAPHTFYLVTDDGYNYTHTDAGGLPDDEWGVNKLDLGEGSNGDNPSFVPARTNWVEVTFSVDIDAVATVGAGAGGFVGYDGGPYYACVAVVLADLKWRWEVWKVTPGSSPQFMGARGPYVLDPEFGDNANQILDIWETSTPSTQIEFRDRNPTFGSIVTDASATRLPSLGRVGILDMATNDGHVHVNNRIRATSVSSVEVWPISGEVLDLSKLGWALPLPSGFVNFGEGNGGSRVLGHGIIGGNKLGERMTQEEIEALAAEHGFPDPHLAGAVAMAESDGLVEVTNTNDDGTIDTGLWQINSVHGYNPDLLLTADYNADAAFEVSNSGTDWSPWVTYNSGAYLEFM